MSQPHSTERKPEAGQSCKVHRQGSYVQDVGGDDEEDGQVDTRSRGVDEVWLGRLARSAPSRLSQDKTTTTERTANDETSKDARNGGERDCLG